ncbi:Acg family FMN-binding oxidoreductase [Longispora albida]|uniref:Acg family FMN-binding oxidoreductase n=1 Tax=Longispora albida TaxID=203523 RepID=UPI000371DF91|nr:hypothetical protein [Longispora albida]
MSIFFTDRLPAERARASSSPLGAAVLAALRAPSILNTQPWRWELHDGTADLIADDGVKLPVIDPDGRLLTVSCGTALHHALVSLTAAGYTAEAELLPDPAGSLLARVAVTGTRVPVPADRRLAKAISARRTDRRPFTGTEVPGVALEALRLAAEANGAHLQVIPDEQVAAFHVIVQHAGDAEMTDPAYRAELGAWTHRPEAGRDGVRPASAVAMVPRRVPVRDFAPGGDGSLEPGEGTDAGTRYAILFTDTDTRLDWLRAGEALSAVLLTATAEGLGVSPMSDVTELPAVRQALRGLLSGIGWPVLALRFGVPGRAGNVPRSPRREPGGEQS